jgi:hypothetical protein
MYRCVPTIVIDIMYHLVPTPESFEISLVSFLFEFLLRYISIFSVHLKKNIKLLFYRIV